MFKLLLTLATLLSTQAATTSLVGGVRVSTDTTGTNTIAANVVITNLNGGASRTALMARDVQVTNAVKVLSLTGNRVVGIGTDKALTNTTVSIATLEALSTAGTNNWINSGTTNSTLAGTAYPWGVEATNHVNVGASGEAGIILFTSTNGTYTASISLLANGTLVVTNNSVLVATIPLSSGYVGAGAKFFTDGSGFVTPSSPIGTVTNIDINPTNLRTPYRSNSTTFGDSPWSYIAAATNALGFNSTNFALFIGDFDVALGHDALGVQTAEGANTAIGTQSMNALNGGNNNVGVGYRSLFSATTGSENVGVGLNALLAVQTGSANVGVGNSTLGSTSGDENVAVGHLAGRTNAASANIFIGYNANPLVSTDTNHIVIGHNAVGKGDNTITLGNTSITGLYLPFGGTMEPVTLGVNDSGGAGYRLLRVPN